MNVAAAPTLSELRARVDQMQGRPAAQPVATHPAFAGLLQLQAGSTYSVDSMSLATALMAGPSADGAWCGVIGSAELGLEAAAAAGVELRRTILVPDPGEAWLEVAAALIDVLGVVVLRAPAHVSAKDVSRVSARLRQRGAILIVLRSQAASRSAGTSSATTHGDWPRTEARLSMSEVEWVGLGQGYGHLQARQVTIEVQRGTAPARRRRLWLPDAAQAIRRVDAVAQVEAPTRLRSVS